jgi:hypothetical protein
MGVEDPEGHWRTRDWRTGEVIYMGQQLPDGTYIPSKESEQYFKERLEDITSLEAKDKVEDYLSGIIDDARGALDLMGEERGPLEKKTETVPVPENASFLDKLYALIRRTKLRKNHQGQ